MSSESSPPANIRPSASAASARVGAAGSVASPIPNTSSIDAVNALDEILTVEGLDGLCVGFNDLAGSMGLSGQVTDRKVIEVTEEVIRKTRLTDKTIGISMGYDREAVTHWLGLGLQWISLGGDFNLLYAKVKGMFDDVRSIER